MPWPSFRRRSNPDRELSAPPPRPWPVDPELSRRVTETRKRVEHTRRELARHGPPDRGRRETTRR